MRSHASRHRNRRDQAPKGPDEPSTDLVTEVDAEPGTLASDLQAADDNGDGNGAAADGDAQPPMDEGPVHRRLIRASLPRTEGQAPPSRPNPEFTIRQPNNNRQNRFRPRHGGRGPMQSNDNGNRSFGGGGGYGQPRQHGNNQGGRRRNRSK